MNSRLYYSCKLILSLAFYSICFFVGISIITNDYSILSFAISWICFNALFIIILILIINLIVVHIYGKK